MKRWLVLGGLGGVGLLLLAAAANAPRVAEARAHEVAAQAIQLQAAVTGLAVGGMLLLSCLLGVVVALAAGLLWWSVAAKRLAMMARLEADGDGLQWGRRARQRRVRGGGWQTRPPLARDALPDEDFDWRAWEMQPWEIEEV